MIEIEEEGLIWLFLDDTRKKSIEDCFPKSDIFLTPSLSPFNTLMGYLNNLWLWRLEPIDLSISIDMVVMVMNSLAFILRWETELTADTLWNIPTLANWPPHRLQSGFCISSHPSSVKTGLAICSPHFSIPPHIYMGKSSTNKTWRNPVQFANSSLIPCDVGGEVHSVGVRIPPASPL